MKIHPQKQNPTLGEKAQNFSFIRSFSMFTFRQLILIHHAVEYH